MRTPIKYFSLLFIFYLAITIVPSMALSADDADDDTLRPSSVPGYSISSIQMLMDSVFKTGAGLEAFPAIDNPKFVTVSDASLSMDDSEIVFIVEYPEGTIRIYPQRILVWHQVINDVLPQKGSIDDNVYEDPERSDRRYTVTYSPVTGSVVAFKSAGGSLPTSFGVTGDLLNSNTMLYDRISHSTWNQLLAVCIDGPLLNKRLERIPVLWATWKGAKKRYLGKADVLSRSTGFKRTYGRDPYGAYTHKKSYYNNTTIVYPISRIDKRLHPKKRILGIEYENTYAALQVDAVKQAIVFNFTIGITPLLALYDQELDTIRVFDRRIKKDEAPLEFKISENELIDTKTNSRWNIEGKGTYGRYRDIQLAPIYSIDCMWFAWAAFHRETSIIP